MKYPKRHVRVLRGIERPAKSFSDPSWLEGKIVVFTRDVTEGTLPPAMLVDTEWQDLHDTQVVSEAEAVTALLGLSPTAATIQQETAESERHSLPLASLAPLQLVTVSR